MEQQAEQADYRSLRGNVSFLGRLLGDTIAAAEGPGFLALIERIRTLSRQARDGDAPKNKGGRFDRDHAS